MDILEVLSRFAVITDLTEPEALIWKPFCEDAILEIEGKLRDDLDLSENDQRRLNVAAATLAFYRYTLYRCLGAGMESFSVGELRIKADSKASAQIAATSWREAKSAVADLLKDTDFVFERI